jgi:hypothetical protein
LDLDLEVLLPVLPAGVKQTDLNTGLRIEPRRVIEFE